MRYGHLARLVRVLEMVMTSGRADKAPTVSFYLANEITRILAHRTPTCSRKFAHEACKDKLDDHFGNGSPF